MNNTINEIVDSVLRENLDILKNPYQLHAKIMLTYGNIFWKKLEEHNAKISEGFKIGLTKRYLEFSLKVTHKHTDTKTINNIFKKTIPESIQCILDSVEYNATVYITYRNLKKTIDKIAKMELINDERILCC